MVKHIPTGTEGINGGIDDSKQSSGRFGKNQAILLAGTAVATLVATMSLGKLGAEANAQTAPAEYSQADSNAKTIQVASNKFSGIDEDTGATMKVSPDGEATIQYAAVDTIEKFTSLDEILESGKVEWMENAVGMYEDYTVEAWEETVKEISIPGLTELRGDIVSDLEEYTPNMLIKLAKVDSKKYPYLQEKGEWAKAKETRQIFEKMSNRG